MTREKDDLGLLSDSCPLDPAIIDDRGGAKVGVITFARLDAEVNALANAFIGAGIGIGARVAWCARNTYEVFVILNAARRIGAQVLALNHQLRHIEVMALLAASRSSLVLAEADFAPLFADVAGSDVGVVVTFGGPTDDASQVPWSEFTAGMPTDVLVDPARNVLDPRRPTFVGTAPVSGPSAFTGGTTGQPKGVLYDRGRLQPPIPFGRIEDEIYDSAKHVFITSGSLSHGGPATHANLVLNKGGRIILQRRFDPEDWLRLVTKYSVTASYCSPTVVRRICALPEEVLARYDVSSIKVIVAGAAKWSYALKVAYRRVFPPGTLWELYGSTELGSNIVMRPDEHWERPESSGRPAEGYQILLLDDQGRIIDQPNEAGVMYVKGPYVLFDGYEGDEEATEAARWNDYWTVGDVAYFDEDGFFYICDRSKDMLVSGGVNVYPAEIEAVIDAFPGVVESAVFGVPDEEWGERVHAMVTPRSGVRIYTDELLSFCKERLASYKVPRHIEVVGELPHTAAGKIDKREIRKRYWADVARQI